MLREADKRMADSRRCYPLIRSLSVEDSHPKPSADTLRRDRNGWRVPSPFQEKQNDCKMILQNWFLHFTVRCIATAALLMAFLAGLSGLLASSYLDPSFGTDGIATTYVGANVYGASIVLQPDAKIVAAAYAGAGQIALARYTMTGTLDTSFGTHGIVLTTTGTVGALARQSDGKLVIVGSQLIGYPDFSAFLLMRYTVTGTVDTDFGTNGVVVTPIGSSSSATSVAIQPDGKIVVAGGTGWRSSAIAIARYNSDGSLDFNFGSAGTLIINLGRYDLARSIALQPDGRIVVAGDSSGVIAVVRCTVSGTLDASFNTSGIVTTTLPGSYTVVSGVAQQSDGKVVVVGSVFNAGNNDILLARYTPLGTLDTSFGSSGFVTTSISSGVDGAADVVVQPDDKIVVGGTSYDDSHSYFAVVRYTPSGGLDWSFGAGGVVTSVAGISYSVGTSVAVQPDGKILLAGSSSDDDLQKNLTIVRYKANIYINFSYLPAIFK
jgi:uncharacterized delta-60 repeat protein